MSRPSASPAKLWRTQFVSRTACSAIASPNPPPSQDGPPSPNAQPEPEAVLRAKSLLFFYALQDRYGQETFNTAIRHMLEARRGRGFNVTDLISSFEQESHENVAGFVRLWMKRPGVPAGFRAHYENSSAASTTTSKETAP